MENISDVIEAFLLDTLGEDDTLNISRNELASYFSVAPSQINYVLSTRFTPSRGYTIESRRGGGGFITVVRLRDVASDIIEDIMNEKISNGITYVKACDYIDRLVEEDVFSRHEAKLVKATISDKALISPTAKSKDGLRLSILKSVVAEALK